MPYGYTAQRGEDFIIKIGASVLECTEKTLEDSREEIGNTTDYELQQNGVMSVRPGPRTQRLTATLIKPDYGETDTAYDAVETAYTGRTQLTGSTAVYLTFDSTDSGTQYNGYVLQFTKNGPTNEDVTVNCTIQLTPVAGS